MPNTKDTKLETERKKKKELAEDLDYLRQVELPKSMGGGSKYVVDKIKEEEAIDKANIDKIASDLQSKARFGYGEKLAAYGQTRLILIDWPEGWEYYMLATFGKPIKLYGKWFDTKEGILCVLRSPRGDVYTRAVLTTSNPIIDMKNVDTLVTQAENTLDSYKGLLLSDNVDTVSTLKKTKNGIYLPNGYKPN
jgi:hypothetical protein